MTLLPLLHQSKDLLAPLGESALRSLAVAAIAALALALIRSGRATARLQVWTSVLYVALAMPLLSIFMPHFNVAIPGAAWLAAHTGHSAASSVEALNTAPDAYLPSPAASSGSEHAVGAVPNAHATQPQTRTKAAVSGLKSHTASVDTPAVPAQRAWSVNWAGIALGIYLLGLVILLTRLLLGIRGSRRLAATAGDISPRYFPRKGEVEDAHKIRRIGFPRPAITTCRSEDCAASQGITCPSCACHSRYPEASHPAA